MRGSSSISNQNCSTKILKSKLHFNRTVATRPTFSDRCRWVTTLMSSYLKSPRMSSNTSQRAPSTTKMWGAKNRTQTPQALSSAQIPFLWLKTKCINSLSSIARCNSNRYSKTLISTKWGCQCNPKVLLSTPNLTKWCTTPTWIYKCPF